MANYYSGKTVLVTGAASGIGRELSRQVAGVGAKRLLLLDVDEHGLVEIARELKASAAGLATEAHAVDVADRASLEKIWSRLPDDFTNPDIAIANAGISSITRGDELDIAACERIMRVNYFGALYVTGLVLPGMLTRKAGHLVVVSSLAGWRGLPGSCAYGASKAAQQIFFEGLRVDLKKTGVKISTVFPGFVDTPINKPLHELYELPFMISSADAAGRILRGVARQKSSIAFPFSSYLLGIMSKLIPDRIYDAAVRINPYKKKPTPKIEAAHNG